MTREAIAKKQQDGSGVCSVMTRDEQDEPLAQLVLTDLWGVAKRLEIRLNTVGIKITASIAGR